MTKLIFVLLTIGMVSSCSDENKSNPCAVPKQITADTACYTGNGVKLTASEYDNSSLEWDVYMLKDSSATVAFTEADLKIKSGAFNSITVPDSLAVQYDKIVVRVISNCQGTLLFSAYFGYVKRSEGNCVLWKPIEN